MINYNLHESIKEIVDTVKKERVIKKLSKKHKRTEFDVQDILSAKLIMKKYPTEKENFFNHFPSVKIWLINFQKRTRWREDLKKLLEIYEEARI